MFGRQQWISKMSIAFGSIYPMFKVNLKASPFPTHKSKWTANAINSSRFHAEYWFVMQNTLTSCITAYCQRPDFLPTISTRYVLPIPLVMDNIFTASTTKKPLIFICFTEGIAIDKNGLIYFVDGTMIRKVDQNGIISTLLGSNDLTSARPLTCDTSMHISQVLFSCC